MKKVGELFQELGFRPDANDDVKIAFIKNLVKAAYGSEIKGPRTLESPKKEFAPAMKEEQLSFDFDVDLKKAN